MSYDECIRTVPAKKKKKGHTVLKKPVKKPNKAVFKVDK